MSGSFALHGPTSRARYDGWAEWYAAHLQEHLCAEVSGHVQRLVGCGSGLCVDAGCGTGLYVETLASLGWTVVGLDVSADMLRLAGERRPVVVQADVARMPLGRDSAERVLSLLTLTDLDDVGPFFREAERILAPGGRLVVITTHPCFAGPFARAEGSPSGVTVIYPGYGATDRVFEGPGIGNGLRSRVGVRHVPLSDLLNKLVGSGLDLGRVEELGKGTVPWLLALVATRLTR